MRNKENLEDKKLEKVIGGLKINGKKVFHAYNGPCEKFQAKQKNYEIVNCFYCIHYIPVQKLIGSDENSKKIIEKNT